MEARRGRPPKPQQDVSPEEIDTSDVSEPNFDVADINAKKIMKDVTSKGNVIFYCKGKFSFQLPKYVTDDNGEIVIENGRAKVKHKLNVEGRDLGPEYETFAFSPWAILDPKTGKPDPLRPAGQFVVRADDPRHDDMIRTLNEARKHPLNPVYTENEWKNMMNPQAFAVEKQLKSALDENERLASENKALEAKLRELGHVT
jgi:hypothetical protein